MPSGYIGKRQGAAWLIGEYNKAEEKVDKLDPLARHIWDVSKNKRPALSGRAGDAGRRVAR